MDDGFDISQQEISQPVLYDAHLARAEHIVGCLAHPA